MTEGPFATSMQRKTVDPFSSDPRTSLRENGARPEGKEPDARFTVEPGMYNSRMSEAGLTGTQKMLD